MRGVLKVVGTFEIKSRNLFVVFGTLTEGELRPGMTVAAPLGGNLSVTGTIESVEFVDFVAYRESYPAITLHYDDPAEFEVWRSVIEEGVVLEASSEDAA
jgi:hypothetical protein